MARDWIDDPDLAAVDKLAIFDALPEATVEEPQR